MDWFHSQAVLWLNLLVIVAFDRFQLFSTAGWEALLSAGMRYIMICFSNALYNVVLVRLPKLSKAGEGSLEPRALILDCDGVIADSDAELQD